MINKKVKYTVIVEYMGEAQNLIGGLDLPSALAMGRLWRSQGHLVRIEESGEGGDHENA